MTRTCKRCSLPKPIQDFRKDSKYGGGYRHQCILCERVLNKEWRNKKAASFNVESIDWETIKECSKCHLSKKGSEFGLRPTSKDGLTAACKTCLRESLSNWSRTRKYGLEPGEYEKMLLTQENRCGICKNEFRTPQVDHNHETGTVRGLLCGKCNKAIGLLEDNPEIIARAVKWVTG